MTQVGKKMLAKVGILWLSFAKIVFVCKTIEKIYLKIYRQRWKYLLELHIAI